MAVAVSLLPKVLRPVEDIFEAGQTPLNRGLWWYIQNNVNIINYRLDYTWDEIQDMFNEMKHEPMPNYYYYFKDS